MKKPTRTTTYQVAYQDGYRDGLAWDLSDFANLEAVRRQREGWDEATLNALGSDDCAAWWGVSARNARAWRAACHAYNAGAYAGACQPQSRRSGNPPGRQD